MLTVWFEKGENLIIDGINIPAPKCAEEFLKRAIWPKLANAGYTATTGDGNYSEPRL